MSGHLQTSCSQVSPLVFMARGPHSCSLPSPLWAPDRSVPPAALSFHTSFTHSDRGSGARERQQQCNTFYFSDKNAELETEIFVSEEPFKILRDTTYSILHAAPVMERIRTAIPNRHNSDCGAVSLRTSTSEASLPSIVQIR